MRRSQALEPLRGYDESQLRHLPAALREEFGIPLPKNHGHNKHLWDEEKRVVRQVELLFHTLPITFLDVPNTGKWCIDGDEVHLAFPEFALEAGFASPYNTLHASACGAVTRYEIVYGCVPQAWSWDIYPISSQKRNDRLISLLDTIRREGIEIEPGPLLDASKTFFYRILGIQERKTTKIA